jgi:hypothetical protein
VSVKVQLPPGCSGFDCKDGTKYTASRPGGSITVDDRHASAINRGQFGSTGLVEAKGAVSFGTKNGQRCDPCGRLWNAWNKICPRCGEPTRAV